jgi:hypothetical protein
MSATGATYRFLSFVREGMSGVVSSVDNLNSGAAIPALATIDVSVPVTGAEYQDPTQPKPDQVATMHVTVQGPGDVIGINPRQVIRTFPRDHTTNAETTMFPVVEFDRVDLPWMFTPAAARADHRLRPWLCLVVVRIQEGVSLGPLPYKPLPVLTVNAPASVASELPDPVDSWLWAHAQVVGQSGGALGTVLSQPSSLTLSRLICPRNLQADTSYLACVVPTFEVGRKAGLGEPVTPADEAVLTQAWTLAAAAVTLPVYFSFAFSTAPAGDFESLAELLHPLPAPSTLGHRPMDVTRPGSGLPNIDPVDAATPGAVFDLLGALCAPDFVAAPWPDSVRKPFAEKLATDLNASLNFANPPATTPSIPGPGELTVGPPIYGQWHAASPTVTDSSPLWLRQLNLDPGYRVTAALGAAVVEKDADDLMASAWNQIGEVDHANRILRRAQFGREVLERFYSQHVTPMIQKEALHSTAPVHQRVLVGSGSTVTSVIRGSALPRPAVTSAMRRVLRQQGPIAKSWRQADSATSSPASLVVRLAAGMLVASPPVLTPDGTITLSDPIRALGSDLAGAVAARVGAPQPGPSGLAAHLLVQNEIMKSSGQMATRVSTVTKAPVAPTFTVLTAAQELTIGDIIAKRSTSVLAVIGTKATVTPALPARSPILTPSPLPPAVHGPSITPIDIPAPHPLPLPSAPQLPIADSSDAVMMRSIAASFAQRVVTVADGPAIPPAPVLPQANIQTSLLTGLKPSVTVVARVRSVISMDLVTRPGFGATADPLADIMAAPTFTRPMYEALRDVDQDSLVPGLDQLLPNTITLVVTNPAFVEAHLIGLNHEMARKLLWREYPTDQRGTYFRRFWGGTDDIGAIPGFDPTKGLGTHTTAGPVPNLVLLVRGELLRRYPSAIVYAIPASGGTTNPNFDDSQIVLPLFRGSLKPDVTFIGFPLTEAQARAGRPSPTNPGVTEDWWFVIAEHPTEPRFGLHNAQWDQPLSPLASWNDLTWAHVAKTQAEWNLMSHAPTVAPFPPLIGARIDGVTYGADAGAQAHVTYRNPVRVAMHALDVLPVVAHA